LSFLLGTDDGELHVTDHLLLLLLEGPAVSLS